MNEELKKYVESILNTIEELKGIRDDIAISDIYFIKNSYGLSNEMVRLIFSL